MKKEALIEDRHTGHLRLRRTGKLSYVGFWWRVLAGIVDVAIVIMAQAAAIFFIASIAILVFGRGVNSEGVFLYVNIASIFIYIVLEGQGGSPAKRIFGMAVIGEDRHVLSFPGAVIRTLGKVFSALLLGFGFWMIGWDEKKQGLHDKIINSYVVWGR